MQITTKNATATAANDVASSGDEVKMLLQGRKQFENMTLGKAAHGVPDNAVKLPSSGGSSSWLDEEMKSIQWPVAGPCTTTASSEWKGTVNSFFQSTTDDNYTTLQDSIKTQSASIEPFLISIRRLLHRYPELMYQEKMTSQIVQRVLTDMGITNFTTGWAKNVHSKYYDPNTGTVKKEEVNNGEENDGGGHGIVVDIGSGQEPCILLRADMDALPIVEQTPLPPEFENNSNKDAFHSNHHGKMHACGHDAHMTMLLGATYLFKSLQEKNEGGYPFPGTIRVIFQPAEEGGAGAKRMVEEGVLSNSPKVKYAFGMHVWPTLLSGQVGFRSGTMFAAHHGKMHACGHDAHMTMLLGATYLFKSLQEKNEGGYPFPGTIRVIFQPAEEGGAGAKRMVEEGVLSNSPKVKYAFGMHVWPTLLSGQVGFRSGTMFAAQDNFTLTFEGVGGHAAFPHLCRDPIVASAAFVMNVQTLVSRGMNPLESGVVTVSYISAGDGAHNVIPSKATIRGTIRALSDDALLQLRDGLIHVGTKTAEAHGLCLTSYEFAKDSYPAVRNDDDLFPFASQCAGLVAETGKHTPVDPTMGAEDFAYLAQGVPSAFFFLGQGGDGQEDNGDDATAKSACGKCCGRVPTNLCLHHPEFNLDEEVMKRGVALFVNLALRSLKDLSAAANNDTNGSELD